MFDTDEFVEVEGRYYSNPQLPIEESNAFIDNLRNTQQTTNAQIAEQTMMLGTNVPSVEGGLGGGTASSYWTSRYQTPQTNQLVQNLRTTAQAQALNEVLQNEQAIWKKRYQDAYRNYQRRTSGSRDGDGIQSPGTTTGRGDVSETATDEQDKYLYSGSVSAIPGYHSFISPDGYVHLVDMETGEETLIAPPASKGNTGSEGMGWSGAGGGGGGGGGR